jgi:hypothetical protein
MDISQAAKLLTLKITEPQQLAALTLLLEELDAEVRTPPTVHLEVGTARTDRTEPVGSNSSDSPRLRRWIIEAVTAFEREIGRDSTPVERSRVRSMVRWLARRVDLTTRARLDMHPESDEVFQSVLIGGFGRDLALHGPPLMANQKIDFIRRHLREHGYVMLETPAAGPSITAHDVGLSTPPAPPTDKATTLARWMVFFWEGMNTATTNAYCPNTDGAVEHVEHYVNILSDFYDQAVEQYNSHDHAGVYEYEVMEELGRWAALRSHEHREMIDALTLLNEANRRHREFFVP